MRTSWMVGAVVAVAVLGAAALAQEKTRAAKPAARVNVVQAVPIAVKGNGTPLPVSVATLPDVNVASLPDVVVSNETLDVRVVNPDVSVSAGTKVVVLPDLDFATLTSPFTSAEIDVSGYRTAYIFTSHQIYTGDPVNIAADFECGGVWAHQGSRFGDFVISPTNVRTQVFTQEILGTKMRLSFANPQGAFPASMTNVKVTLFLRR